MDEHMHIVPTFEKDAGTAMPTELLGLRRARLLVLCESFPSLLFHVLLLIRKCSAAAAMVPSDGQLICPPYKISEREHYSFSLEPAGSSCWGHQGSSGGHTVLPCQLLPNYLQHGLIFRTVKWA